MLEDNSGQPSINQTGKVQLCRVQEKLVLSKALRTERPLASHKEANFVFDIYVTNGKATAPGYYFFFSSSFPRKHLSSPSSAILALLSSVLLFLKFFSQAETRGDEGLSSSVIALVEDDRPGKRGVAESRGAIPETFRTPEAAAQVLHLPPRVRQR